MSIKEQCQKNIIIHFEKVKANKAVIDELKIRFEKNPDKAKRIKTTSTPIEKEKPK